MDRTPHVYLIPGFLGFANLGELAYFGHVRRVLATRLAAAGLDARIHIVHTPPTASLPRRAARIAATIAATARGTGPLHLIGHSSGGLDARLFTAPEIALPTSLDVERFAARVRSVVTIATPHHGTPLASFFTTLRGQQLLQLLSLLTIYMLHFGHLPLAGLLWMGSRFVRLGGHVANSELLDELFGRLLEDFTPARRRSVRAILRDVVHDQALMLQLTPEAMEVFNASVLPRAGVRYGAVVAEAARPSVCSTIAVGLDPAAQVTRAIYGALYRLTAATPRHLSPRLAPEVARALRHAYGATPSAAANDGIVPTRSQAWGRVVHAAIADHLDVLGHFRDASLDPPHVDWLVTGSGFDRARFEALWSDVTRFLTAGADATEVPASAARMSRPTRGVSGHGPSSSIARLGV
jgi:hypothetical protein